MFCLIFPRRPELKTTSYRIVSGKIPVSFEGFRIAVLADLHDCLIGEENRILIDTLKRQKPDVILLAGDMITEEKMGGGVVHQEQAAKLLSEISKIAQVYYGMGNHEQRWREIPRPNTCRESFEHWEERLREWGITLLDNRSVQLVRGEDCIRITGLALPNRFYNKKKKVTLSAGEIREMVGPADRRHFQILLGHTPQFFSAYMHWGADVALAGHYHGGVIRLPWLGGVISTNFRLFPKYDYGRWTMGKQCLIVSAGLGCHTIPVRLNNPPELVILELRGR